MRNTVLPAYKVCPKKVGTKSGMGDGLISGIVVQLMPPRNWQYKRDDHITYKYLSICGTYKRGLLDAIWPSCLADVIGCLGLNKPQLGNYVRGGVNRVIWIVRGAAGKHKVPHVL